MGVVSLEINDAELTVAEAGNVVAVEHGYALVEPGGIVTGREAYGAAALYVALSVALSLAALALAVWLFKGFLA